MLYKPAPNVPQNYLFLQAKKCLKWLLILYVLTERGKHAKEWGDSAQAAPTDT